MKPGSKPPLRNRANEDHWLGKAALKTHALQTLRNGQAFPKRAKRLECVRFTYAFRQGAAWTNLANGCLFRFRLTGNGRAIVPIDPRLEDRVANNTAKFDLTESENLLLGTDSGIGTDIETGPTGNVLVVSLSNNAIYEIFRRQPSVSD